ncbi:interleukin-18-binding protein isoform X3 [Chamaea fasciata]|uniref:interleukin-18-binding protein isoform X3 n=1 Tax=Chamaea fasciata TaxID=190680 RepID=UPI00336AEA49
MYGSGRRTALGGTSRDLRDPGRRMLGEPRGHPAWILLLCWSLATCCTGAMALQPPSITILRVPAELPRPGESMTVSCEALSGLPEFTLLYWLENGFFVESLHPDGAVHEGTVHLRGEREQLLLAGRVSLWPKGSSPGKSTITGSA